MNDIIIIKMVAGVIIPINRDAYHPIYHMLDQIGAGLTWVGQCNQCRVALYDEVMRYDDNSCCECAGVRSQCVGAPSPVSENPYGAIMELYNDPSAYCIYVRHRNYRAIILHDCHVMGLVASGGHHCRGALGLAQKIIDGVGIEQTHSLFMERFAK